MTYHIEGRRWFQRSAGNTYHSVKVWRDGKLIVTTPRHYGYGEQYLETALAILAERGDITRHRYKNGSYEESGTRWIREELNASYSVVDVARESDL